MADFKKHTSLTILLLISFIFANKYIHRLSDYSLLISFCILILQFLSYKFDHIFVFSPKFISALFYTAIFLLLTAVIIAAVKIPVETLNIDRFSVITSFIDEALKGNYPYYAQSVQGNYPGPMPFYFLIAFPFYLIGELSFLSALGYGLFVFFVLKKIKAYGHLNFFLFYLLTSIYVYWEIAARSNIFTISVFILFLMDYFLRISRDNKLKLYSFALIAGLLLSTRSVYIIVYMVFFLSELINKELKFKQLFFMGCFVFVGFFLSFLPILIFFRSDFLIMNPFTIQSSFIVPQIYVYAFMLIAFILTFTVKNNPDKFFVSGLGLFISILIYAFYAIFENGIHEAIYGNSIDISYFIFCIPFFIYYLLVSKPKVSGGLI